jgi:hypothetical protein
VPLKLQARAPAPDPKLRDGIAVQEFVATFRLQGVTHPPR